MIALAQASGGLAGPVAPAWVVLPLAAIALIVIAVHWVQLAKADMPATRKRIRTACGAVMMLCVPVFAYAFGVASPSKPREFVLAWMLASSMLLIVLLLACVDLLHTASEAKRERARLHAELLAQGEEPKKV